MGTEDCAKALDMQAGITKDVPRNPFWGELPMLKLTFTLDRADSQVEPDSILASSRSYEPQEVDWLGCDSGENARLGCYDCEGVYPNPNLPSRNLVPPCHNKGRSGCLSAKGKHGPCSVSSSFRNNDSHS